RNAALVEEAAAAAQSLDQQAGGLVASVAVFRTEDAAARCGGGVPAPDPVCRTNRRRPAPHPRAHAALGRGEAGWPGP
ncbi:MAG TPA: hypothetical protein VIG68_06620, partial [Lysobacter sp.]